VDARLEAIINKANKKYGEGTVLRGADIKNEAIPRTTSGSLAIDVALGGGWAANQWNEVVGDESHGKTALVMRTIAANQALDPDFVCVWFAAEEFVPSYATMLGCDLDRMVIVEDNTLEVVFQMAIDILEERAADAIVVDSLPALVSIREGEGSMEDLQPGQAAFLTGKFFRKSSPAIKRSLIAKGDRNCTGFIINQWREKIGGYGDPRITPGGKAKNFYYFIRAEVRRDEWITNTKDVRVGQVIKVRNLKNKTAPPGAVGIVDFYFADGLGHTAGSFDVLKETVSVGILHEVIARAGAYYRFGGQQWQGREALIDALRDDDQLRSDISEAVLRRVHNPSLAEAEEPPVKTVPKKKAKAG
jgi:recombination protein RecA